MHRNRIQFLAVLLLCLILTGCGTNQPQAVLPQEPDLPQVEQPEPQPDS